MKPFNKDLFELYDAKAKILARIFLNDMYPSAKIAENSDPYGVDLIVWGKDLPLAFAEVEVKTSWKGKYYPWDNIRISYRKHRIIEEARRKAIPTWVLVCNRSCKRLAALQTPEIRLSRVIRVSNQYVKNELFYSVSTKYAFFFYATDPLELLHKQPGVRRLLGELPQTYKCTPSEHKTKPCGHNTLRHLGFLLRRYACKRNLSLRLRSWSSRARRSKPFSFALRRFATIFSKRLI